MTMLNWLLPVSMLSLWNPAGAAFDVTLGAQFTCALNRGEGVKCWGYNDYGGVGLGPTTRFYEPQGEVLDLGDDFVAKEVKCGFNHCCSVSTMKKLKCWGANFYGQLGLGDTDNRGDDDGEMGNDLEEVQLPTGFVIDHIYLTMMTTYVMSTDGQIVCFGQNQNGQCGTGDADNVGDDPDEIGDSLVAVDLGDFNAVQLGGGWETACALSSDGEVKCWGLNDWGQLGQGHKDNLGDDAEELGNFLSVIDLDTGFNAVKVSCATYHCCALSAEGTAKCWGGNDKGQLGYEDMDNRGDGAGQMGANLPVINLGTNFIVGDISAAAYQTFALSTTGELKGFGQNHVGQLGYEDMDNRGYTSGELGMGNDLPVVDIGSGFTESGVRLSSNSGNSNHVCVFEESTELLLKCWGYNWAGQLGYGDTTTRGDGVGGDEMGDNLLFVNHGLTFIEATTTTTSTPPTSTSTAATGCDSTTFEEECGIDGAGCSLSNGRTTGSCCRAEYQCSEGEGDCDSDDDCLDSLICGTNNCDSVFPDTHDCCIPMTAHYVVRGNPTKSSKFDGEVAFYCLDDEENQAAYYSKAHDYDIVVSCCSEDGSSTLRPSCNAHPATYQDAVDLCAANTGYRLCTLQEMLVGKTIGDGCYYDWAYNWVSDECELSENEELMSVAGRAGNADLALPGSAAIAEETGGSTGNGSTGLVTAVIGAVVGVMVIAAVAVFVVLRARKKRMAKEAETEMAKAVDVPDLSPLAVSTNDGATEKL